MSADHLDPIVEKYFEHLVLEGDTPHNTMKARRRTLRTLDHPGTATREEVEAWWITRAHLSKATRANDLANLRTFYRWAVLWEHRLDDPTIRLKAPRVDKGLPRPARDRDVDHLLTPGTLDADLRRAVALSVYTGVRVSEAAAQDWDEIDVDRRRMRVTGKGNKTRVVGIVDELLEIIGPELRSGNVVAAGGEPYTATRLERRVNRWIRRAGVNATFHQLRHRYATVGLQATGGNLLAVSRALGHASVSTTQIYTLQADSVLDDIAAGVRGGPRP